MRLILNNLINMFFFFKQKPANEMRIRDWSSDVCSSDLVGIEPGSIAKNPREAKNFSCAARPRRVRAGFEFTKSISAKLRLHRPIKSPPGILRSINPLLMMERTVLFYDFHRQYRMPRSQNVLRLGKNSSLGPTGP